MGGPGSPQPLILLLVGPVETLPLNPKHSPPLPLQRRVPTRHQSPIPFVRRAWGFGAIHGFLIRQMPGIHVGIGYIHVCSKGVPVYPPWDPRTQVTYMDLLGSILEYHTSYGIGAENHVTRFRPASGSLSYFFVEHGNMSNIKYQECRTPQKMKRAREREREKERETKSQTNSLNPYKTKISTSCPMFLCIMLMSVFQFHLIYHVTGFELLFSVPLHITISCPLNPKT